MPIDDASRQKKQAARLQDPPRAAQHRLKLLVIARKMQDRAAQRHIGESVREGHGFDGLHAKVVRRKSGRERSGQVTHRFNGSRIVIHAKDLITFP